MKKNYLLSVILPFNCEAEEIVKSIETLKKQSVGFFNIQIILVDDCFNENVLPKDIELQFKQLNNVVYHRNNSFEGLNKSRVIGYSYSTANYVLFGNVGDIYDNNAFNTALNILNKYEDVDIFALLNSKTKSVDTLSGVVDINDNYDYNLLFLRNLIIRKTAIDNEIISLIDNNRSEEEIVSNILIKSNNFVCESNITYTKKTVSKDYYTSNIDEKTLENLKSLVNNNNFKYIDNIILSLISRWFYQDSKKKPLLEIKEIKELIGNIDEDVILNARFLKKEEKVSFLNIRNNHDISEDIELIENDFCYKNVPIIGKYNKHILKVANMDIFDDHIEIYGKVCHPFAKDTFNIFAEVNEKDRYEIEYFMLDSSARRKYDNEVYYQDRGFKVSIPRNNIKTIGFKLLFKDEEISLFLDYQFVCKLTHKLKSSYYVDNNYLITKDLDNNTIVFNEYSFIKQMLLEISIFIELLFSFRIRTFVWRFAILIFKFFYKLRKKQLWMFVDYFVRAGDNAEAVYKYYIDHQIEGVDHVFVVDKSSQDYKRIEGYSKNVVAYNTIRYKLLFAISDCVITSQTFYSNRNTFRHMTNALKNLFHFKYVYLQHGVIKDNHADTLAHYKTALDIIITSAQAEYNSLMSEEYQLSPRIVKLTGLGRYDDLLKAEKADNPNKILLAPTWRQTEGWQWNETIQGYVYQESFKEGSFFKFFNGLITDQRVLEALEKNDYTIEVQLHPRFWNQRIDFTESERVVIEYNKKPLNEEVKDISLLITDYSSIAFDYAFRMIPAIYAQFDKDDFYSHHAYTRGYFDFENDGFGPVCYDYESTVKTVVEIINNKCDVDEEYKRRMRDFYKYRDGKNCQRIYEELRKLNNI